MTDTLTKPLIAHLSFEVDTEALAEAVKAGKREIEGLAVPYGVEIDRENWMLGTKKLRIEKGSITFTDDAKLFYNHDTAPGSTPLGRVLDSADSDAGKRARASLSKTPKADEVYTLLQDGTLSKFSIGFKILAYSVEDADTDYPVLVVTEGLAHELSVVPYPAYDGAAVEDVLSDPNKGNRMTDAPVLDPVALSKEDADALTENVEQLGVKVETLTGKIATLGNAQPSDKLAVPFESFGEYVKEMAAGNEDARKLFLAYAGGTIGDTGGFEKDGWLGDITKWVDKGRKVFNLLDKGVLPPEGMGVEYGKLATDTTAVAKQAAEGDTLAYGKLTWTTDTAPLDTYGGWGEASRQQIERSSINIVDTYFKALALRYAAVTEAAARTKLIAASAHQVAGVGVVPATADKWIDFLVDGAVWLDDKGMSPDFLLVTADVFKGLAKLRDGANADAPRLLDRDSGAINITGLKGDLFSIPVIPIAGTNTVRLVNGFAMKTFESGGAPLRLADEDITNLTKAFSVYGYLALAVQDADAIVKPVA